MSDGMSDIAVLMRSPYSVPKRIRVVAARFHLLRGSCRRTAWR